MIGVVGDVRNNGIVEPGHPEYYVVRKPAPDDVFGDGSNWRGAAIVVRGPFDPRAMAATLRSEIAALAPALPVSTQTLRERVAALTAQPRFNALLLAGFAFTGLALGAAGVYGVVAFLAGRRRREIGVRLALGATPAEVARVFLGRAARWVAGGVSLGLAGSWIAARLFASLVAKPQSSDIAAFAAAAALLAAVAFLAAWVPSRRAAALDPAQTLRE